MQADLFAPTLADARPFPLARTARIAVLASGRGSNLASLVAAYPPVSSTSAVLAAGEAQAGEVALVVSNKPAAPALARAAAAGVRAVHVPWDPHHDRQSFEDAVLALLRQERIDLVCLAGFMRVLSPRFTRALAGRLLNIHPSLLPAFRGLHAQRQALEAGVSLSGCTVHLVDAGVDTGPIVLQRSVPVLADDDEETLSARILEAEHHAYPEAVAAVLGGWRP